MKTCTFFGHKDCPDNIKHNLIEIIQQQIVVNSVQRFYVGYNGNFDKLVINCLQSLKAKYPSIECFIILDRIPTSTNYILHFETIYPSILDNVPPRFRIDRRNQWMINQSEVVITYIRFSFGGASKFAQLAKKQNKIVLNLYKPL